MLELNPDQFYLSNIMLDKNYRGQKLGQKMLNELLKNHNSDRVYTRCRTDALEIVSLFKLYNLKILKSYEANFNSFKKIYLGVRAFALRIDS